ncbi:helix-turn-helix transcriptional regulator [Mucilaginibacter lacusdianchii]|uniref:helix-turn-helix transcriptional regulator n=1 Tax=Mucilaginibacter lacusdianchii TaxID=2684211 RepID=UPI00131AEA1A|nr:YafY family protein [Mucilaginibacter sp. JXJ CY 39]
MNDSDIKRISRLTAIVTQLQTKRLITATQLADRFQVSVRTIYRDIKALEQAGVPILTQDGKGYTLMEGYRVPPVMFTESEASALVIAEQMVTKSGDNSLVKEYLAAIGKIKAVLNFQDKEKMELLSNRIAISPMVHASGFSDSLTLIQNALTSFKVLKITYCSPDQTATSERLIEPFALYYSLQEKWLLIAYCRLRKDFRMFRLDRILKIRSLDLTFEPHKLTLEQYLKEKQEKFITPDIPLS